MKDKYVIAAVIIATFFIAAPNWLLAEFFDILRSLVYVIIVIFVLIALWWLIDTYIDYKLEVIEQKLNELDKKTK